MSNNLYNQAEEFVKESFRKAGGDHGFKHFVRTVHWVKKLKPDPDEAMLIAAIAHDIERAFRDKEKMKEALRSNGFKSETFLNIHQTKGAKIIADFLEQQEADPKLIERVKMLVGKHEFGGNEDQNILKDADSIRFFENNLDHFIKVKVDQVGKDRVKEKFDWMFNRISSKKAKQIALKWYEDGINRLKN